MSHGLARLVLTQMVLALRGPRLGGRLPVASEREERGFWAEGGG